MRDVIYLRSRSLSLSLSLSCLLVTLSLPVSYITLFKYCYYYYGLCLVATIWICIIDYKIFLMGVSHSLTWMCDLIGLSWMSD